MQTYFNASYFNITNYRSRSLQLSFDIKTTYILNRVMKTRDHIAEPFADH